MVWLSLTWNLGQYQQTVARLLRRGQLKEIYVHRLVAKGTRVSAGIRWKRYKVTTFNQIATASAMPRNDGKAHPDAAIPLKSRFLSGPRT